MAAVTCSNSDIILESEQNNADLCSDVTVNSKDDSLGTVNNGTENKVLENGSNEIKEERKSESILETSDPPTIGDEITIKNADNTSDEYHYLKTGEFSSENFKVMVKNIPKKVTYGCFRSGMKSALGFKPKKVKYDQSNSYAFLGFSNEKEREEALIKLNDRQWKGTVLACVKAAPAKDPFVQNNKRKNKFLDDQGKRLKFADKEDDNRPPEERIVDAVCPYASKPYEEQLSIKEAEIRSVMETLSYKLNEANGKPRIPKGDLCLELLPIIKSPILNNYRNKVEFSIGKGEDKTDNVVGFRLSSYRDGCLTIAEPTKCINVPQTSITVAKEFQEYIQNLSYPSYDSLTKIGLWQMLTVRTCTTSDTMVIIQVQKTFFNEADYKTIQQKIIEHFTSAERTIKVSSVYMSSSKQGNNCVDLFEHLSGNTNITEKLLGLQFRISAQAFFQVNTPAAEVLYSTVREWCHSDEKDTCVLDVCCGTGTIGICIANETPHQVTGIELSEEAVKDARHNAEINEVKNAQFIAGSAEDVINSTMKNIKSTNIIAILDPPRAGLRRNVAETLRACSAIRKIIYVSCSPKQAIDNFIWLCRPESKRFRGSPFKPIRAVPVDLFPHSRHCELIVELERTDV